MTRTLAVASLSMLLGIAPAGAQTAAETPAAVDALVSSRSFRLESGYPFAWNAEKPLLTEGTLLVLEASPSLVRSRAGLAPVLYVGGTPAERLDRGHDGRVIAIVPGTPDLATTLIWFGPPALPEQIDRRRAIRARMDALRQGIRPLGRRVAEAAKRRGGPPLSLADRDALRPVVDALRAGASGAGAGAAAARAAAGDDRQGRGP